MCQIINCQLPFEHKHLVKILDDRGREVMSNPPVMTRENIAEMCENGRYRLVLQIPKSLEQKIKME